MIVVLTAAFLIAACAKTSTHVDGPGTIHTLAFREVVATFPCNAGSGVAPPVSAPSVARFDRDHKTCYRLGPVLLTGNNVESAQAVLNPNSSQWEVDVRFSNDDFADKVATPEVGKNVAIVLDDVVQSTPMINAGIVGRDVTISGDFDEVTARGMAAAIAPSGTPIDAPVNP